MGIGKVLGSISPLAGALTGEGAFGGLQSISPVGLGIKALTKKKKPTPPPGTPPATTTSTSTTTPMKKGGKAKTKKYAIGGAPTGPGGPPLGRGFMGAPPPGPRMGGMPPPGGPPPGMGGAGGMPPPGAGRRPMGPPPGSPPGGPSLAGPPPGGPPPVMPPQTPPGMKCGGRVNNMRKGGKAKRYDTGGETFKDDAPSGRKFVSNPVVQDWTKIDRTADDRANAAREKRLAARSAPATKTRVSAPASASASASVGKARPLPSASSPKTNLPTKVGDTARKATLPTRQGDTSRKATLPAPAPAAAKSKWAGATVSHALDAPKKAPDYTGPLSKTPKAAPEYKGPLSKTSPTFSPPKDQPKKPDYPVRIKLAPPGPKPDAPKQANYPIRNKMPDAKPAPKADWSKATRSTIMDKPKAPPKYTGPLAKKAKGGTIGFAKGGRIDGCAVRGKTRCKTR